MYWTQGRLWTYIYVCINLWERPCLCDVWDIRDGTLIIIMYNIHDVFDTGEVFVCEL